MLYGYDKETARKLKRQEDKMSLSQVNKRQSEESLRDQIDHVKAEPAEKSGSKWSQSGRTNKTAKSDPCSSWLATTYRNQARSDSWNGTSCRGNEPCPSAKGRGPGIGTKSRRGGWSGLHKDSDDCI